MKKISSHLRLIWDFVKTPQFLLGFFLFFSLFNPLFKKYDYGAGLPLTLLFAVIVGFLAFRDFRAKRERDYKDTFLLSVFLVSVALSFVFSQTKNLGFSEVLAVFSIVPLYLLYGYQKIRWGDTFLKTLMFVTVFSVTLGYIFYFFAGENRMFGPFFNLQYHSNVWPNAFAFFLLLTWPLFLIFVKKKDEYKAGIVIGIILSALLLTYSRGAFVAFVGQSFLLAVLFLKKIDKRAIIASGIAIFIALLFFTDANYVRSLRFPVVNVAERVNFENGDEVTSKMERVYFWEGALQIFKDHPMFGTGPFSFRYAYNPIQKNLLGNSDHPHNIFLKIASENGVFALLSFLLFLFVLLVRYSLRYKKLSPTDKMKTKVLFVALAGGFAHSMIDYNLNFMANLLVFSMLIVIFRSSLVGVRSKVRSSYVSLLLGILIAVVALYEGGILAISTVFPDSEVYRYSIYPRFLHLQHAEIEIKNGDYKKALKDISDFQGLNRLDASSYILQSKIYCDENSSFFSVEGCVYPLKIAMKLDPLNRFDHYLAYVQFLSRNGDKEELTGFANSTAPLLLKYFDAVRNNLHFTAFSSNVEKVRDIVKLILPYVDSSLADKLSSGSNGMLKAAKTLRTYRVF